MNGVEAKVNAKSSDRLRIHLARAFPWLLALLALALVLSQVRRPGALIPVWIPWVETGSLAMVLTAIILTGGIDLSVGSMVALCGMVIGVLWHDWQWPIVAAVLAAMVTGILCGALNGTLVTVGLSPLVATLATMAVFRGLAMTISGARRIIDFPESFLQWNRVAGVPPQFLLLGVVSLVAYIFVHHTPYGRICFAIGDNRLAATLAAHPVRRVEWCLYTVSGLVAGAVAVLYTIDREAAIPDAHRGVELQAIACVVVGGTSIAGGSGSLWRTGVGLVVIANLDIGLQFLGTQVDLFTAESRLVAIGLLLIVVAIWNQQVGSATVR